MMENRVGTFSIFDYVQLRESGVSSEEIERVLLDPILQELQEEENFLLSSLENRIRKREEDGEAILNEASNFEITQAALSAIQNHQQSMDLLEATAAETSELLTRAIQDQKNTHKKKEQVIAKLQEHRMTLRKTVRPPVWADDIQRVGEAVCKGMARTGKSK